MSISPEEPADCLQTGVRMRRHLTHRSRRRPARSGRRSTAPISERERCRVRRTRMARNPPRGTLAGSALDPAVGVGGSQGTFERIETRFVGVHRRSTCLEPPRRQAASTPDSPSVHVDGAGSGVRIAQLANFVGPASGGMKTAIAALGQGYADRGHARLLIVPGRRDAVSPPTQATSYNCALRASAADTA